MARDNGQSTFQRGVMSMVILGLLKRADMYGYQLVQETERVSGRRIVTQEGSLYPVLYKLVDQGLISDKRVQVGKRMTRVYYHLEPAGEQRLKELIQEYEQITQGVFLIVREADAGVDSGANCSVPLADIPGTAGQLEGEKADRQQNGKVHPGVCV